MLPIAPLMIEHRLIEKMIKLMAEEVLRMRRDYQPDLEFINSAVDFIKTYADKLHHGKEEDILFRDLAKKHISADHNKIMDELIREHVLGRGNVKKLVEARTRFVQGEGEAVKGILENMEILVKFYPKHIEIEDKHFFIPVMSYFNKDEQDAMFNAFNEFDRKFIHFKYKDIVTELAGGIS